MRKLFECVPNFSEGRRAEVVDAIAEAISGGPEVVFFDREMDANHNRAVLTFVGTESGVAEAALRGARAAVERIDLTRHRGEHPRIGALDVLPFVPLGSSTMADAVRLARDVGRRLGTELEIPVYLYGEAAVREERRELPNVRKGEFEGLREELGRDPERNPDFGPPKIHPTAGATAVGARFFLVAYNVNLKTPDVKIAKAIARKVREASGGLPRVKALGFDLKDRALAQVSMNLTDYRVTSILRAFETVEREAKEMGVEVLESEIVGLVPEEALDAMTRARIQLAGFHDEQVIERKLAKVL